MGVSYKLTGGWPRLKFNTFAEWLKWKRDQVGLTQDEVAIRVGCKKAYISKLEDESRKKPPPVETLHALSVALGTSVVEPLLALGYVPSDATNLDSEAYHLLSKFQPLPPDWKDMAVELIDVLAQRAKGPRFLRAVGGSDTKKPPGKR